MKNLSLLVIICVLTTGHLLADVGKRSKSVVTFKGFGTYTTEQDIKITENVKREDSKNKFDGKGIAGKIAGKLFIKASDGGEIVNLSEMNIYELDHKKKKYTIRPIEKITLDESKTQENTGKSGAQKEGQEEQEQERESDIEIVKSEFKVEDTGETQVINNFPCKKYTVLAYTQWRNKETEETGTDSLFTIVWSTAMTDELQRGQQEEMDFHTSYMQAIGFDMDTMQKEILGTNWMQLFGQMKREQQDTDKSESYGNISAEMNKIQGYPVLIDGKYYALRPEMMSSKENQENQEEQTDVTDLNKSLGGIAKGLFGKKSDKSKEKENGLVPALAYYTELLDFKVTDFEDSVFQVPGNYKMDK